MKDWTPDYLMERAVAWHAHTFPDGDVMNVKQRVLLVLEEAMELAQAAGLSRNKVTEQADSVYAKPIGDIKQEIAGLFCVSLLAAKAIGIHPGSAINDEIDAAYARSDEIREKSKRKVKVDDH